MTFFIAPIVEGQTEDRCIERLLQKAWRDLLGSPGPLRVLQPSRCKRDALLNPDLPELEVKVEEASLKLVRHLRHDNTNRGLLLLLLDAERDCPAELAPRLLASIRALRADVDSACVFAKRMLENWIVAGASTLAGVNGLPNPLPSRSGFEEHSGAAWLDAELRRVNPGRKYKKTADALVFVQGIDLQECRANSPSFAKLCRDLEARLRPTEVPPLAEGEATP